MIFSDSVRNANLCRVTGVMLLACILASCSRQELPFLNVFEQLAPQKTYRIAVLPLRNNSDYAAGANMATRLLLAQLNTLADVDVVLEGDVRGFYQQLSIYPSQRLSMAEQQVLSRNLDIRFFITGTVLEMADGRNNSTQGTPRFVVKLQVIDAQQGRTVATAYHRRQGSDYCHALHFGCLNTLTELVQQTYKEVLQQWQKENFLLYSA